MDRIERAVRTVEARIKESGKKKKDVDVEAKGLLARMKKKESKKEVDDIERVAQYVKQIRETKEAILNGRNR